MVLDRRVPVLVSTSSLEGARPFDADSPFRWGSISKSVTALTALEATHRRQVPLNVPVTELLEPLPYENPWATTAPLRLAHLLELSGGLPELTAAEFDDNTPHPLKAALARRARSRVLLWPPGLQHSYSNVAPGITAAIVERLTGSSFEDAARRLVFVPLGMHVASFEPLRGLPGGFRADGQTEIPYWHMTFRAFGALNASPRAMARFLQALLDSGRIGGRQAVARDSVSRMYRAEATLGARRGLDVGYGAGLYGWVHGGHLFHGHGGDADGYRSRFGLLRDSGRGYLLGINVDNPSLLRRMQRITERALTADLDAPAAPPAVRLAPAVLARYTGTYYPSSTRFHLGRWQSGEAERARLVLADGELQFVRNGDVERLIAVAAGRFRRARDPAVSIVLAQQDGVMYLQGELGNFVRVEPGPCAEFLPGCTSE